MSAPFKSVILLTGPIGVGKTTLGRALAARLGGAFLDADDFGRSGRPWYGASLSNCRRLLDAMDQSLAERGIVVAAKPLRWREWSFFRFHLARRGVRMACIGLTADLPKIVDPGRGRSFSPSEVARIAVMLAEGYGERRFCDVIHRTDAADFAETLAGLDRAVRRRLSES